MDVQVREELGRYAVLADGEPVRTPLGHPVRSVSRELMEAVADDIRRDGPDPEGRLSLFGLQAAYLDLAASTLRADLEAEAADGWDDDDLVHAPPRPAALAALWGKPGLDPDTFETGLESVPLRALLSVMRSGSRFKSPVLAYLLLARHRAILPLAMGNCARLLDHLAAVEGEEVPASAARFRPEAVDEDFCRTHCLDNADRTDEDEALFRERCPSFQALEVLRRFAAFPEEPEPSLAV